MGALEGQVALITAGGGGIARATAKLFAENGAKVMAADLDGSKAAETAEQVRARGGDAAATAANVLVAADCARVVRETVECFGKVTVLINLVGLFGQFGGGTVDQVDLGAWDRTIDINLKSVFLMSKYAIPEILRAGGGAIVNTGTLAAVIGRSGSPAYGTAKSGVLSLTRAMAADYFRQGIRVNCVCPSGTQTPMYVNSAARQGGSVDEALEQSRRSDQGLSLPEDIAPAFLYLASNQLARKVTGHILMVDNGFAELRL